MSLASKLETGVSSTSPGIVVEPQFASVEKFSEGLACVKSGKTYGFIDKTGVMVIPNRFDIAASFSEGLALWIGGIDRHFEHTGGQWGYINHKGEDAIKPAFDAAAPFCNGLARIAANAHLVDPKNPFSSYMCGTIKYIDKSANAVGTPMQETDPRWNGPG